MRPVFYSVETEKPFEEAVRAVEQSTTEHGFRVLYVHDIAATLAEKGFSRDPLKIVEICNARYANEVLKKNIRAALMLPCSICVHSQQGRTYISTMLPSVLVDFFPESRLEAVASAVETAVRSIIDKAKA
jgi:uncharacterized protein (DUF302 family)